MSEYWNTRGGSQWVKEQNRYDTMLEPCGRRLLEAAVLTPGERVLDAGCGNGATTLLAATRVGARGQAVGIDLSGPMLDTARKRASEHGVSISFVQGDAQTATFDSPFDAVISRFGVMFFDDPTAAFANLAKALRPGGRICFVCWQEMLANDWVAVPALAVVSHVGMPELPDPGAPGPFSLADPDRIRQLLTKSGLSEIEIVGAADDLLMGSDPQDVVGFMATDELGRRLLEGRDSDKVAVALEAARSALEPHATPKGILLGSAYWIVTARKVPGVT
jgi:SAM-dependent methyltransferase